MVGSHLAEYLLEHTDWDVIGMCRWRSPLDNLVNVAGRINSGDRISLLYGDLRDTMSIQHVVSTAKPDYVFHLAAQSFPRTSFDSPLDTMDTNVQGTVRVLDALKQHAPKAVIHVCASSEVFGRVPKEKLPIDEDCLPPNGRYFFPSHCRMTMVPKIIMSKSGVDKISFLPAYINHRGQPYAVNHSDPKFAEILKFTEWVSDQHPHKFRVDGDEVVVETVI